MFIIDVFIKLCDVLVEIVKRIDMCLLSKMFYEIVVKKKNCLFLSRNVQICDLFEYYCVLSDDLKYVIEVCVLKMYIVGINMFFFVLYIVFFLCCRFFYLK